MRSGVGSWVFRARPLCRILLVEWPGQGLALAAWLFVSVLVSTRFCFNHKLHKPQIPCLVEMLDCCYKQQRNKRNTVTMLIYYAFMKPIDVSVFAALGPALFAHID